MVASWWRHSGVVVALWWRHGGVMVALVYAPKPLILLDLSTSSILTKSFFEGWLRSNSCHKMVLFVELK